MPAVAATNPPVLIAMVAAATERIRVGSGGVMLPNHAPLVVAEQFALLEAAHPGRIDLGIGRAPGTDPVTQLGAAARRRRGHGRGRRPLPRVRRQRARPDGRRRRRRCRSAAGTTSCARPRERPACPSSGCWAHPTSPPGWRPSAGLPYVFAHHFSGSGTAEALALYRSEFRPSTYLAEPRTFLTVNAAVAPNRGGGRPARAAPAARHGRAAYRGAADRAAAGRGGREGRTARGPPAT